MSSQTHPLLEILKSKKKKEKKTLLKLRAGGIKVFRL